LTLGTQACGIQKAICWIYSKCYIFFISQGLLFLDLF
jgi:hypothetical protein